MQFYIEKWLSSHGQACGFYATIYNEYYQGQLVLRKPSIPFRKGADRNEKLLFLNENFSFFSNASLFLPHCQIDEEKKRCDRGKKGERRLTKK